MDAVTVIDSLRACDVFPSVEGERLRVYGDSVHVPAELRQAITDHRADIITLLCQPEQSLAYDLLDVANEAGWHPTVTGDTIIWRCGDQESPNPMPTPPLRDALDHHAAAVIRVLLDVPEGCRNHAICSRRGICASEIRESVCFRSAPSTLQETSPQEHAACTA